MRPILWLALAGLVLAAACDGAADPDDASTTAVTPETTTTTEPGTTTTEGRAPATVGVIGCSMTLNALDGYHSLGGEQLWPPAGLGYGRGSVARWTDPQLEFWDSFVTALDKHPETDRLWWQLCTSGSPEDDMDHALQLLDQIEEAAPDSTIYVSAQPRYSGGHVCASAGADGPARMEELADDLVGTGRVERGPQLSSLSPETLTDSCHANDSGMTQMGQEVLDFFAS